jgi:hypothetical protein
MLTTTAVETATEYIFTVTDGDYSTSWSWGKQPPEGQSTSEYLQSCKREAELLASHEIVQLRPPTPIVL